MADSRGLVGATWVMTATFTRIPGYFGNDLDPTRPDSAVTPPPSLPSSASKGAHG
jgi:hypothetical protein